MKSRHLKWMLVLAIAAAALDEGFAQELRQPPAVLGFIGSADYGHVAPISTTFNLASDPYANTAFDATAGVMVIFPKIVANGFGLSTSLSYGQYAFNAGETADETITDQFGRTLTAQTHHSYELKSQAMQMDLLIYGQIGDVARLEIGPWGGVGFLPHYTEALQILQPSDETFSDGQRTHSESVYATNSLILTAGGMVRASLEIHLGSTMSVLPFAQLRVGGVTSNKGNDAGIVGMLGGGLGILFGQPNGVVIEPPPVSALDTMPAAPTPTAPTVPVEPPLGAKVDLYSRDAQGRHHDTLLLTAHRTLHRMEVPLMSEFHFERNSAALPARYAGYSAATHSDFTLDAFADTSPAELHRQALNVIGMRLAASPTASVIITGAALADEPKWFAGARAEAVGNYLRTTWGARPEQIRLQTARGAKAAHTPSVSIASVTPGILDPVATQWIEQEVSPTPIGLEPEIVAPRGIREWHASIRQGDREIGVVRDTDSTARGMMSASELMAGVSADGPVSQLSAELIVQDSAGATAIAHDNLAVILTDDTAGHGGMAATERSVSRYFLTGIPGAETDRSIERIVASATDSASISLRPVVAGQSSPAASVAQERLRFIADRLRGTCAERGLTHVAIGAREATAMTAGDHDALPDADQFATPIEVTVIN